jgi:hypothetical protein
MIKRKKAKSRTEAPLEAEETADAGETASTAAVDDEAGQGEEATASEQGAGDAGDEAEGETTESAGDGGTEPDELAAEEAPRSTEGSMPALQFVKDRYLTIDRRVLGLFRILFGILLIGDALRRLPDATFFFSNEGVLPNHFALYAPLAKPFFSLYTAFSSPGEVKFAIALTALAYIPYLIGYRTKIAQVVAFVLVTSLSCRNIFVENGGCIVVGIVAAWTMFLPVGDRFSVDALLKSMRSRRERTARALEDRALWEPVRIPHQSLAVLAIVLQIFAIYFFNTVHKEGATWKNGEAIHWVLWQNRIATVWTAWLRMHEPSWLSPVATRMTLIIEGSAAFLPLLPFAQRYVRTTHVVITVALHAGIALLMTLGPFSYIMILLNFLMLPPEVLDAAAKKIEARLPSRTLSFDPKDGLLLFVARLLARLDPFGKLHFVERGTPALADAPSAVLAVRDDEKGSWTVGSGALAEATRALPAGLVLRPILAMASSSVKNALQNRKALAERFSLPAGVVLGAKAKSPMPKEGKDFVLLPPPSPLAVQVREGLVGLREAAVAVMIFAAFLQVLNQNWWIPKRFKVRQPRITQAIIDYPRLLQGWSMFSPDAPREDGTIVVDGVTADGRHLDPFTGAPPDFEAPLHGPWFQSQFFCDYFLKIHFDGNKGYRQHFKHYLQHWQELEGKPAKDKLVSFDVYWINNSAPPPGSTTITNIRKTKILSSGDRD